MPLQSSIGNQNPCNSQGNAINNAINAIIIGWLGIIFLFVIKPGNVQAIWNPSGKDLGTMW